MQLHCDQIVRQKNTLLKQSFRLQIKDPVTNSENLQWDVTPGASGPYEICRAFDETRIWTLTHFQTHKAFI